MQTSNVVAASAPDAATELEISPFLAVTREMWDKAGLGFVRVMAEEGEPVKI